MTETPEPLVSLDKRLPRPRRSFLGSLWQARTGLGIDIGSRWIKVAQIRAADNGVELFNLSAIRTPEGSVSESKVVKARELAGAIRRALRRQGIAQRKAAVALSGSLVFLRQLRLPKMPPKELRQALVWEAEQNIPIPPPEALVDHAVLKEGPDGQLSILLAGADRKVVEGLWQALRLAGVKPIALEFDAEALLRGAVMGGVLERGTNGLVATVDLGDTSTRLAVFKDGHPLACRSIAFSGRMLTERIAREMGVSEEEAEELKLRFGALSQSPVEVICAQMQAQLTREIARSLEFFLVENRDTVFNSLLLAGGGAMLQGLVSGVADGLGLLLAGRLPSGAHPSVELINPLGRFGLSRPVAKVKDLLGTEFALATGLALRNLERRVGVRGEAGHGGH